jgi:hypothetical protein
MYQAMAVWCRLAYRRYGNTVFGVILSHDKRFVLPRQARYKHKEKLKEAFLQGGSVAIWGGSEAPPKLTVEPKTGCTIQRNFWGGGVVPRSEARKAPAPHAANRTVLRPCNVGAGGTLASSQRWLKVARPGGAVAFELQDGSGRCLSVVDCGSKVRNSQLSLILDDQR